MLSRFDLIGQTDRQTDKICYINIARVSMLTRDKNRMCGYPTVKKSLVLCLAVSRQYRRVTHGQTDGRSDMQTDRHTDRHLETA